jgi:hypothetical protein
VFGKLRKVGGGVKQKSPSTEGDSKKVAAAPAKISGGGGGHKDVSWKDLGLFGDEGSNSSDEQAEKAAKAINGLIRHWGDWAEKNKDKFTVSKGGSVLFKDDEAESFLDDDVKGTLHDFRHAGADDSEVRDEVYKHIYGAMKRVHGH